MAIRTASPSTCPSIASNSLSFVTCMPTTTQINIKITWDSILVIEFQMNHPRIFHHPDSIACMQSSSTVMRYYLVPQVDFLVQSVELELEPVPMGGQLGATPPGHLEIVVPFLNLGVVAAQLLPLP